jgi:hypothetical protein
MRNQEHLQYLIEELRFALLELFHLALTIYSYLTDVIFADGFEYPLRKLDDELMMDLRRIIKLGGCATINGGQLDTDPVGFTITCIIATVGVTTTISELYPAIPYAYTLVAAMSTPFIINIYRTIITKASVVGSD